MSMIFQSYALWPHMTVTENVAYGLTLRKLDKALIAQQGRTRSSPPPSSKRLRAALSGRALRRAAAARRARARADRRAGDAAARRAAVEPRRQSARGDALRGAPPARRIPLHHRLRDARPVRGDDHGRSDRRDERRQDRAGRHAGGDLQPAALGIRRALHRVEQRREGQGASMPPTSRSRVRRSAAPATPMAAGKDAAISIRQHEIRLSVGETAPAGAERRSGDRDPPRLPRQQPRLYGRACRRHAVARGDIRGPERPAGREGLAGTAAAALPVLVG